MASASSQFGKVKIIANDGEFTPALEVASSSLVVIDFHATWCGPCLKIAPEYEKFATKYPAALFLKVDVDQCEDTAAKYGVTAMPTFIFIRSKVKIDTLTGGNPKALEEKIKQHLGSEDTSDDAIPGQMDLSPFINKAGSTCLNDSDDHPFLNALTSDDTYLESDCDEQLLMMLSFNQPVKLHSIKLRSTDDGKGPKTIKLFINQPNELDFDQAEQREAIQKIDVEEKQLTGDNVINLRYVKFQNVQNVSVFILDNQGGEETTVLKQLQFYGTPVEATNMNDFKRIG